MSLIDTVRELEIEDWELSLDLHNKTAIFFSTEDLSDSEVLRIREDILENGIIDTVTFSFGPRVRVPMDEIDRAVRYYQDNKYGENESVEDEDRENNPARYKH